MILMVSSMSSLLITAAVIIVVTGTVSPLGRFRLELMLTFAFKDYSDRIRLLSSYKVRQMELRYLDNIIAKADKCRGICPRIW